MSDAPVRPAAGSAEAGESGSPTKAGKPGTSGSPTKAGRPGKAARPGASGSPTKSGKSGTSGSPGKAARPGKARKAPKARPAGAPPPAGASTSRATPVDEAPRRPRALAVDLLPAGLTGLGGAWIAAVSLWTLIMGGGIGRAWAPVAFALGVLALRCAYLLIVGAPPMWLMFAQACGLRIAMDVMDWALIDSSQRLPWPGWVAWVGVWGAARALNLYLRRRAAARV